MKKITKVIFSALLPAMLISLTACSAETSSSAASGTDGSSISGDQTVAQAPSEITAKIMEQIEFPSMAEISADRLASYYDMSADTISSFSAYLCGSGAYPDEIAIFKMKSSDDIDSAKAVLEERLEYLTKTFENYTPDEMYKIDDNNIVVNGSYIALIVCSDNEAAINTFKSMSK